VDWQLSWEGSLRSEDGITPDAPWAGNYQQSLATRCRFQVTGIDMLRQAWQWYFGVFPNYQIEVDALLVGPDFALLTGSASATHSKNGLSWSIPAAWKAKVVANRMTHWQVYADNRPVYEILARGV
jgi:ketosteroid isomerase-like protein